MEKLEKHTLSRWRFLRYMTQDDLGEKIGVSRVTISKLENNFETISKSQLLALAYVLDIKPEQIVEEEGEGCE